MNIEDLKKSKWAKLVAGAIVAAIGVLVGVNYVEAQEVVVTEVPEGKKIVLVDKDYPEDKVCLTVDAWKLHVPEPAETSEECDELVVSPSVGCSD